jgi:hypothetical protein
VLLGEWRVSGNVKLLSETGNELTPATGLIISGKKHKVRIPYFGKLDKYHAR